MSTSHPKSGPSEKIEHDRNEQGERKTTFTEKKETEDYTRTQVRTYEPKKDEK